jgi:hypothetical protein
MSKTVMLPKSVGMTLKEATETIRNLGITGVQFRSLSRGAPRTPRVRRAPVVDSRGARFVRDERVE